MSAAKRGAVLPIYSYRLAGNVGDCLSYYHDTAYRPALPGGDIGGCICTSDGRKLDTKESSPETYGC